MEFNFFVLIATMPLALQNSVDIELLIEGSRDELFKKITSQDFFFRSIQFCRADHDDKASHFLYPSILTCRLMDQNVYSKFKCDTFEHFYYAFEFKGYVVCPAFLVSMFNLTDYACLDVSNGSHYYYIFLSRKEDDPLPIILSEQF